MHQPNQWNELADIFACTGDDTNIPESAADNILIAWPSLLRAIEQHLATPQGLTALDYGCGGGLFCRKLHDLGFRVTGYDPSMELLKAARQNVSPEVNLSHSPDVLNPAQLYDLITSVMVLQFIDDIDAVAATLARNLNKGGLLIYAVFNPAFIADNMACKQVFIPADKQDMAYLDIKPGVHIPFFIRSADDYRELFGQQGLQEIYYDQPPFTRDFIHHYGISFSTRHAEFLIQAFKKA